MGKIGGGNSNIFGIFTQNLGFHDPFWLYNIFQNGWFNHQTNGKILVKPLEIAG